MDHANFNRLLSSQLNNEILLECHKTCFNATEGSSNEACLKNCTLKQAILVNEFRILVGTEWLKIG